MNPHVLLPLLALYGCDHNIQFPGPDDVAQDTGEGVGPSPSTETLPPDMDRDGWNVEEDCDDFDPEVHPGAKEVVADGVDQDCDGGDTCHEDLDGDGYGTTETVASDNPDCVDPGESQVSSDCDDTDDQVHPGADEHCDGVDEDCDGAVDEDAVDVTTWYRDFDGDCYGDAGAAIIACDRPDGYLEGATDCDDEDAGAHPGAEEVVADGVDQDCDGGDVCYEDFDGDGYGTTATVVSDNLDCEDPEESQVSSDCDDMNDAIHPGADEHCDGADEDCDGDVDENAVDATTWHADADGDHYGDAGTATIACDRPDGYLEGGTDCDDEDAAVHPGADELCNDADDDCDGDVDEDLTAPQTYCDTDCDGVPDAGALLVPEDYSTITEAIAAATEGDRVCVAAGTYVETIDFDGKDIVVEGYEGKEVTTIDGNGDGSVVTFANGESSAAVLAGFTVTGGSALEGGGILVSSSDPTLRDLIITYNVAYAPPAARPRIGSGYGAGVYVVYSNLTMLNVEISNNMGINDYHGLMYYYWFYGPGMYASNSVLVLNDVVIEDNYCLGSGMKAILFGDASGALLENSDVVWSGGSVSGATADGGGGGDYEAYGIHADGGSLELDHLLVADNESGGIYAESSGEVYLTNVIIGGSGFGLSVDGQAEVTNCDIVGNDGGALAADSRVVLNTNIVGNVRALSPDTADISYCNFYDNGSDPFYGSPDPTGSDGNISVDPLYGSTRSSHAILWDLTLDPSSPCIDAGDPSILDADGTTSDIGAYGGPGGDW